MPRASCGFLPLSQILCEFAEKIAEIESTYPLKIDMIINTLRKREAGACLF